MVPSRAVGQWQTLMHVLEQDVGWASSECSRFLRIVFTANAGWWRVAGL